MLTSLFSLAFVLLFPLACLSFQKKKTKKKESKRGGDLTFDMTFEERGKNASNVFFSLHF